MKHLLKYLLSALVLVGCSNDFLETDSTELISADRMAEVGPYNPEIFDGTIRGLYSLMYQNGTGGTNLNHDDFGQKNYDIYSDMLCGDMVLAGLNYGWYEDVAMLSATLDYRTNPNYMPWRYYYRIIRAANSIIDGLGGNDMVPDTDEEKWQMGQAKTMRAYCYFYLSYLYANTLEMNAQTLPLYRSKTQVNLPLSSAADVWAGIKSDLESSVTLLDGYEREGIHGVNQDVARGLLAYTYLSLGDYDNAVTVADQVIGEYDIIARNLTYYNSASANARGAFSYFDGRGANWIWGMDLTLDQGLDLVSWWGQVDMFTYSYAWAGDPKTMDMGLFTSIRTDDSRRSQFLDPWSEDLRYPLNKFYHELRTIGQQREITADYLYMRVEEMHLIKAEALAFDNQDGNAIAALKVLLAQRITDASYVDALTGQALKDEIYKQWRIEMWGEGKSYLAMKRNKATITRQGHIDLNDVPIPYNDDRLTFKIPYQEYQDNPNIN